VPTGTFPFRYDARGNIVIVDAKAHIVGYLSHPKTPLKASQTAIGFVSRDGALYKACWKPADFSRVEAEEKPNHK
jgi:hypothetical protein